MTAIETLRALRDRATPDTEEYAALTAGLDALRFALPRLKVTAPSILTTWSNEAYQLCKNVLHRARTQPLPEVEAFLDRPENQYLNYELLRNLRLSARSVAAGQPSPQVIRQ